MASFEAHYEQVLAPGERTRPDNLSHVWVHAPSRFVEPSEEDELRRQFFERIERECATVDPEFTKGIQGAPFRDYSGFPLLEKYFGAGAIWLIPSKSSLPRKHNWVVIVPAAGPFAPGSTFNI